MMTITLEEIERDVAGYLRRVGAGETLLIMQAGQLLAEIKPPAVAKQPRPIGLCAGEFRVPDDFNAPLPDHILEDFEGR